MLFTPLAAHQHTWTGPSSPTALFLCSRRAIMSPRRVPLVPSALGAGWALSAFRRPCRDLPATLLGERPRRIALNYTQQIRDQRKFDPKKNKNYGFVKNGLRFCRMSGRKFWKSHPLAPPGCSLRPHSLHDSLSCLAREEQRGRVVEKTHPALPCPPPPPPSPGLNLTPRHLHAARSTSSFTCPNQVLPV